MPRSAQPTLDNTQQLLAYGLEMHGVPRTTAIRLARQYSEAHVLREMCYYNFECGARPKRSAEDWRWLVARIREQLPAPKRYPFPTPD